MWPHCRFACLGRLACQYLIDLFCKVEDEKMEFIRRNQALLTRRSAQEEAATVIAAIHGQIGQPTKKRTVVRHRVPALPLTCVS